MHPVSQAFLDAAVASAQQAEILVTVTDAAGNVTVLDQIIQAGVVVADRTRDARRSCTLTLIDPDGTLTPDDATDLLAPFGNEIRIWRGIPGELVPLGVLKTTKLDIADGASGLTITIAGVDRSIIVRRNRWVDPYVIAAGTAVEDALDALLADRYPDVVTSFPATGATLPQVVLEQQGDPWQDAREIARAAGYELYFDRDGFATMAQPATVGSDPAVAYVAGDQAVLLDLSRSVSTESSVYNGVIAIGESTGLSAPVRGEAWDEDSSSPTYRHGPFGQVPLFWTSPLLGSDAQAAQAAQTRLDGIAGAAESIAWQQIVNAALDANDVIDITRDRAGLAAVRVVLDQVAIPLNRATAMSAAGRRPFL